jgi:hypothetical protein
MRFLISLFLVLTPVTVLSAGPVNNYSLGCSTSVAVAKAWSDGTRFNFHLEDGAGFTDFPIFSGTVTPSMLPLVERGAKELAPFGGLVDLSWDLTSCKFDASRPLLFSCRGQGLISQPKNAPFITTSLSSEIDNAETLDVEAKTVNINLGLSTTGTDFVHYFISFPFASENCRAN